MIKSSNKGTLIESVRNIVNRIKKHPKYISFHGVKLGIEKTQA